MGKLAANQSSPMGRKARNLFFAPLILNKTKYIPSIIQSGRGKRKTVRNFDK
jgi:hypothetical protein